MQDAHDENPDGQRRAEPQQGRSLEHRRQRSQHKHLNRNVTQDQGQQARADSQQHGRHDDRDQADVVGNGDSHPGNQGPAQGRGRHDDDQRQSVAPDRRQGPGPLRRQELEQTLIPAGLRARVAPASRPFAPFRLERRIGRCACCLNRSCIFHTAHASRGNRPELNRALQTVPISPGR